MNKLQFSNVAYVWRMSDCIMGLRSRLFALILFFLSFPILHVLIETLQYSFSQEMV